MRLVRRQQSCGKIGRIAGVSSEVRRIAGRHHDFITGGAASLCPGQQSDRCRQRLYSRHPVFSARRRARSEFRHGLLGVSRMLSTSGRAGTRRRIRARPMTCASEQATTKNLASQHSTKSSSPGTWRLRAAPTNYMRRLIRAMRLRRSTFGTSISYAEITPGQTRRRSEHLRSIPTVQTIMSA